MQHLILILLAAGGLFVNAAFAAAVSVNGTCELGDCATPDTLASGETLSEPFNFIYTFANGDTFQIQGVIGGANTAGTMWTDGGTQLTVAYLGNGGGGAAS